MLMGLDAPFFLCGAFAQQRELLAGWKAVSGERGAEVGGTVSAARDQDLASVATLICSMYRTAIQCQLALQCAFSRLFYGPILHSRPLNLLMQKVSVERADHSLRGRPLERPNKATHLAPSAQVINALAGSAHTRAEGLYVL